MPGMTSVNMLGAMDLLGREVVWTPMFTSTAFDSLLGGCQMRVEAENARTRSFKFRSAYDALATWIRTRRSAGVIAAQATATATPAVLS
ncbi:hypothetical protein OG787_47025 [Streptomyces sp. NBC_00075]|uniref:hypothetical protein n=1 Tax=Streptomyces sp. NBC_00075 TaxID=2975641 RepID=UPI00324BA0F7